MPGVLFSIVVFLQVLFTIIHAEDTFDCTGYEDDSYHPIYDAGDCRHYWHCIYVNTVYMHAVKRVCPAGTEFDTGLRQCETSSLVDCAPPESPHMPRTSSTTKAWKWKYSKLFSRIRWKTTVSSFVTTRRHQIFDLGESVENDITTMAIPEVETTQQIKVLPFTVTQSATGLSLEELSKNLNAMAFQRHDHKSAANVFQPGEPENEADVYATTMRRTRRTRYTTQSPSTQITTTESLLTTAVFTTEAPTTITTLSTMTTITISLPPTSTVITRPDTTINMRQQQIQARLGIQRRRDNMTLYILTSDEHKIRQFSINHTRGILVNCNQLRRRLLGRRRLREVLSPTTNSSLIIRNSSTSSIQTFHYYILSLTILSFFFLQK